MQNKPNLLDARMNVSAFKTMTNNNEQPAFNYSKQTQFLKCLNNCKLGNDND